jgi:hypothetical protein
VRLLIAAVAVPALAIMSESERSHLRILDILFKKDGKASDALEVLNSCSDDEAKEQLLATLNTSGFNSLMLAVYRSDVPEELIRAMVERGKAFDYINVEFRGYGRSVRDAMPTAHLAIAFSCFVALELLLTLGADPRGCRERVIAMACPLFHPQEKVDVLLNILDRFEQRTTLACCLHYYDELHQTSPRVLHSDIAALDQFATILHDIHGINGDMHSISRMILSYI